MIKKQKQNKKQDKTKQKNNANSKDQVVYDSVSGTPIRTMLKLKQNKQKNRTEIIIKIKIINNNNKLREPCI